MFYSNDISKMFPQFGTVPKKTTFPKAITYSRLLLYTVQLWVSSRWSTQSTSHTTFFYWFGLENSMVISVFSLGVRKTTKDSPIGYSISVSQGSKHHLWRGVRFLALRGTSLRCLCFVLCSLSISPPLLVLITLLFPTTDCFLDLKGSFALWLGLSQN